MGLKNLSLFFAMMRNLKYSRINRDMIGHTITRDFGPIVHDDIYLYVDATLDRRERYADARTIVPPFYMSRLLFPMFRYFLVHRELHVNLLRMVHGQQEARWFRPIRAGDRLRIEMSVDSVTDTPAGEVLNLRTRGFITSDGDELAMDAVSGFIVRGAQREKPEKEKNDGQDIAAPREIFRVPVETREGQQLSYARVSGDTNFMHTSNLLSRLAGLPRTILHGVCLAAMTGNALLDEVLKGDMDRIVGISLRFAQPVIPGERLIVVGYEATREGEIPFEVIKESGRRAIRKGLFWYRD